MKRAKIKISWHCLFNGRPVLHVTTLIDPSPFSCFKRSIRLYWQLQFDRRGKGKLVLFFNKLLPLENHPKQYFCTTASHMSGGLVLAIARGNFALTRANKRSHTVIRFAWDSSKFGTCTVVSVNGTLIEAKMCTFTLESTNFVFNQCPIYTHDGASAKFRTNSHKTD
jgi:hypothetical protein